MDIEPGNIEIKRADRQPENIISVITQYVESHPPRYDNDIRLIQKEGWNDTVVLKTSSGIVLNNLLPDKYRIIYSDDGFFYASANKIEISRDTESLGMVGKIFTAHEFGHALHEDFPNQLHEYFNTALRARRTPSNPVEAKIEMLLAAQNTIIDLEIQGWHHGKIVADMLEIDPAYYEDVMNFALDQYFMYFIEKLTTEAALYGPVQEDQVIKILDPKSQEYQSMTLIELRQYVNQIFERNRSRSFDQRLEDVKNRLKII